MSELPDRGDWLAERPDYDLPETCPRCKALLEDCEGHRMNACDLCQRDLPDDAGAPCGTCMWAEVDNSRNQEWWA